MGGGEGSQKNEGGGEVIFFCLDDEVTTRVMS